MRYTSPIVVICAATVLLAAGCKKSDQSPQPQTIQLTAPAQESVAQPSKVPPRLPDPKVPMGAEAASPLPGQAGDTSSEAFKNGGNPDPHK